jgi:hypothetical protein
MSMRCHAFRTIQIVLFLAAVPQLSCGQPTSEDCPVSYGIFNDCVGWSGDGYSECENCYLRYVYDVNNIDLANNETFTSCTQLDDETCAAAEYCSAYCAGCQQELVTYFECEWGCTAGDDCASSSNGNPSPTSAPTVQECPNEAAAYNECIERNGAKEDCNSCIGAQIPEDGINSCAFSEQLTCRAMEDCPICGDCQDVYTTWIDCLNKGSCLPFNCTSPTTSPTEAPTTSPTLPVEEDPTTPPDNLGADDVDDDDATCALQRDELKDCMFESLTPSQSENCRSCVEGKFDQLLEARTATKCSTIQSELCDAVAETCECGACAKAYHELVKCRVDGSETGCKYRCDGIPGSTSGARVWGANPSVAISSSLFLLLAWVL